MTDFQEKIQTGIFTHFVFIQDGFVFVVFIFIKGVNYSGYVVNKLVLFR